MLPHRPTLLLVSIPHYRYYNNAVPTLVPVSTRWIPMPSPQHAGFVGSPWLLAAFMPLAATVADGAAPPCAKPYGYTAAATVRLPTLTTFKFWFVVLFP